VRVEPGYHSGKFESELGVSVNTETETGALLARVRAAQLPPPAERAALRHASRATLRDLAAALGVTAATVWRWETGRTSIRLEHAIAYRQLLDQLRDAVEGVNEGHPTS
jgi:DNA-binding transcriptional regulator YiaG